MSEEALCKLLHEFEAIDAALNDLISIDRDPEEKLFLDLHRRWEDACSRAAATGADSLSGFRAKARILVAVLRVLAPAEKDRNLHERLAESLARDLLSLSRAEKLC